MASEPAEPTTRQDVIDKAAQAITRNAELIAVVVKACKCCASSGYEPGGGAPYPSECAWCDHEPDRHGEKELAKLRGPVTAALSGLLADPAQTTELEEIQDALDEFQVRDADGPVPNVSLAERVRVLFDEWREVTAERDEARAQRNEAMETAGQLRGEVHEHQVAAANLYGRVFVALGLSITEPWAGLADAAERVRSERDALSLLLRGMARKLVAYRKWHAPPRQGPLLVPVGG